MIHLKTLFRPQGTLSVGTHFVALGTDTGSSSGLGLLATDDAGVVVLGPRASGLGVAWLDVPRNGLSGMGLGDDLTVRWVLSVRPVDVSGATSPYRFAYLRVLRGEWISVYIEDDYTCTVTYSTESGDKTITGTLNPSAYVVLSITVTQTDLRVAFDGVEQVVAHGRTFASGGDISTPYIILYNNHQGSTHQLYYRDVEIHVTDADLYGNTETTVAVDDVPIPRVKTFYVPQASDDLTETTTGPTGLLVEDGIAAGDYYVFGIDAAGYSFAGTRTIPEP